ncbi:alkaline phosphatase [Pantoea sp. SGAir0183]
MSRKPRLYRTAAAFSLGKLSLLMLAMGGMTASSAVLAAEVKAKNVIIMINDGAGWGTWDATAYWQYGSRESTPYAAFPAKYAMTTYPLNASKKATHNNASLVNYDPQKAWDTTRTDNKDLPFRGYDYLAVNPTDSAAAGTALASGIKTYNNAINVDNNGQPVDFVTLTAKAMGKATGVVTSVPFSHATPAAFGAQNASRNDYHAIAKQMLTSGKLETPTAPTVSIWLQTKPPWGAEKMRTVTCLKLTGHCSMLASWPLRVVSRGKWCAVLRRSPASPVARWCIAARYWDRRTLPPTARCSRAVRPPLLAKMRRIRPGMRLLPRYRP